VGSYVMKGRSSGFTLVEVLIVVAILGLLAAIAAVALPGALDRARQRRTMMDLHTIGVALESYSNDLSFYPRLDDGSVEAIAPHLAPTYVRPLPVRDGWSRAIVYRSDGVGYTLVSWGADGVETSPWVSGPTHHVNADIVLSRGQFVQWPEGIQVNR